jgi:hypothetical protein
MKLRICTFVLSVYATVLPLFVQAQEELGTAKLTIPKTAQSPTIDGKLSDGEWDNAATFNGLVSQFDGTVDPRPAMFWLTVDDKNVYIAQRSSVQPREWSPKTPPIWFDKGDSSFVIGLAPGRVNRGDEPSHYLLRINLHGQALSEEITGKIKGVRLTYPHPAWQVKPEIKSAFNADKTEWTSEVAIPLESMKVEAIADGEPWRVFFARDYEAADQTAVAVSSDWRFGNGRRHYGRAFYNLYRFEQEWPPATMQGTGAKATHWQPPRPNSRQRLWGGTRRAEPRAAVPDLSFLGYQKGGGMLVSTSELEQYGVYTGSGEKELTATSYDPITGDFYARLDIASLPEAHKAVRGEIVIRKAGETKPLVTHPIPDFRANIMLRMGQDHGPRRNTVLEWVAPAAGTVDIAYECGQMYHVPAGRNAAVSFQLVHYALAPGTNTVLIPRQGLTRAQGWVPYAAQDIQVAKGDKIQLLYDNWDGTGYDDGRMRGKLTLTTADGHATDYWPGGEFATKQGGTSGVWFYRFDDDTNLNPDGSYPELKVQGHPQGPSGGYSGADWLWFPGNESKLNPWQGNSDPSAGRAWACIRLARANAERKVRFHLPELTPGVYQATASVYSADDRLLGQARQNFIRFDHGKDLPWLGNTVGVTDQVLPPWTPVTSYPSPVIGNQTLGKSGPGADQSPITDHRSPITVFSIWGRDYRIDGSGLFSGIDTAAQSGIDQAKHDILAGPVTFDLVQDGKPVVLTPKGVPTEVQVADHLASWKGAVSGDGWRIETEVDMEYDGYARHKFRIVPPTAASDKSATAKVNAIRLIIPLKPEYATHLHAAAGDWFRNSVSSIALAQKDGLLWHSGQSHGMGITPQTQNWGRRMTVGDFKPYVWIGGANRGLAFMADNDQGWVPDDTNKAHAIEVVRVRSDQSSVTSDQSEDGASATDYRSLITDYSSNGSAVCLILNLVARPFAFAKPRQIVFSLQATPIRPLPPGFRDKLERLQLITAFPGFDQDGWDWNGCRFSLDGKYLVSGHGSQPYPLNWDRNIKKRKEWEGRGKIFTPYQSQLNVMSFGEVDDPRMPPGKQVGDVYGYLYPHMTAGCLEHGNLNITQPDLEYRLWCCRAWIKGTGLQGLYFDQTEPILGANPAAGCGYVLDLHDRPALHGKVQPGYLLSNTRQFYKRLRAIFVENGVADPMIWIHDTDAAMVSAFAFVGALLDGENGPELTPEYPWFSAKYAPERMQAVTNPGKWGIGSVWLSMIARSWNWPEAHDKAYMTGRSLQGYARLHDYADGWNYLSWAPFDRAKAMTFYPYWDPAVQAALATEKTNILVGAYRQDNRLQVIVFNRSKDIQENVTVQIDAAALGLTMPEGTTLQAKDLKGWGQKKELPMTWQSTGATTGTLAVEIPPHDYRSVLLSAETDETHK